jgi:hypothetical protein
MHSAPAVNYPVGRSRFQAWLVGVVSFTGMLTGLLWWEQAQSVGWRQGLFVMSLLLACIVSIQTWLHTPRGCLHWDGQSWRWTSGDTSICGYVTVHLDLQFCLLLSLHSDAGARIWIWPERHAGMSQWNTLRRAVFSRTRLTWLTDGASDAAVMQIKL